MISLSLDTTPTEARKFFHDDEMRSGTPGPDVVRVRMPSLSGAWGSISMAVEAMPTPAAVKPLAKREADFSDDR